MEWKKYDSIENTYNEKIMELVRAAVPSDEMWVVTEKVDGSNGSYVVYKDTTIKMAKRTSLIGDDDNFDGMKKNLEKYKDRFIKAFKYLSRSANIETITIYGENFGGYYKHPDVAKIPGSRKIQGRVQYTPDVEFIAFDIIVRANGINRYLDFKEFKEVCEHSGIVHTPVLFIGSLEEALAYHNDFETKVPAIYNLPPIENNIAEGVVIKPVHEYSFYKGDRVILKNKNDIFSEVKVKIKKEPIELTDEIKNVLDSVSNYITENRLHNIISHFPEVYKKDFGKVLKAFNEDILKDFFKDNEIDLEKKDYKVMNKFINSESANLLKKKFFNYTVD